LCLKAWTAWTPINAACSFNCFYNISCHPFTIYEVICRDSTFKNYSFLRAFHNTKSQNKTQMCCNLNKRNSYFWYISNVYTICMFQSSFTDTLLARINISCSKHWFSAGLSVTKLSCIVCLHLRALTWSTNTYWITPSRKTDSMSSLSFTQGSYTRWRLRVLSWGNEFKHLKRWFSACSLKWKREMSINTVEMQLISGRFNHF